MKHYALYLADEVNKIHHRIPDEIWKKLLQNQQDVDGIAFEGVSTIESLHRIQAQKTRAPSP